jgi:hypothetical protein
MILTELLLAHKEKLRQKLIEALAKKYSLSSQEVEAEHKEFIEQYIADKYETVEQLIEKINVMERPVILNIRRSRSREDKCKLCEANQPNIDELEKKYGDSIEVVEVTEDMPDGAALYLIIFHEEAKEKKLPLTAVVNKGDILKFWAGKTVEPAVYEMYIKKILS